MTVTGCIGPGENAGQHPTGRDSTASAPSTSSSSTSASSTAVPSPVDTSSAYLPSPIPELPDPAAPTGPLERLTGVVGEGTERGCTLLHLGQGEAVLLVGGGPRLVPGAQVVVEGHRSPQLATTCQQGSPFVVARVVDPAP